MLPLSADQLFSFLVTTEHQECDDIFCSTGDQAKFQMTLWKVPSAFIEHIDTQCILNLNIFHRHGFKQPDQLHSDSAVRDPTETDFMYESLQTLIIKKKTTKKKEEAIHNNWVHRWKENVMHITGLCILQKNRVYILCTQVYLKQLWTPSGFILLPCSVDLLVKCHGERHTKQLEKQNNFHLGSLCTCIVVWL